MAPTNSGRRPQLERVALSSGLECAFIEVGPGQWYYLLQDRDCPVQAWDWREYASGYGPFPTEDDAIQHLNENHQNPGGWSSSPWVDGYTPDEVLTQRIAEAKARPMEPFHRREGRR